MKAELLRCGAIAFAVVSIAGGQPPALLRQYSSQNVQSAGAVALSGGVDRLAVLTRLLTLTSSQQAQAKVVFDEEEEVTKPLIEQLKQAMDALTAAEKTAATDPDIEQLARNLATITSRLLAADAKAQSKIYLQLTAEQQLKIEQLPHLFVVPTAPLLPPGPVFISSASGGR